ncbi:MAG: hypothetical protein KF767_15505 [Bdellovibrionaceae bacterium]|nr:hypothetical protein [Pseudobdellovibrionaceae bacterium]
MLLLSLSCFARAANTETYRDIIEKAQTLSLQKERGHALQLLTSSLTRESKKGPAPKELVTALEEVASLFLSDKAQQLYELALSLRENEPQLALQKLADAAKLEPDNLQIQLEQFRVSSILGNCNEAGAAILRLYESLSTLEVVRLAAAQAQLCRNQLDDAQKIRNGFDFRKSPLMPVWTSTDVEILLRQKKGDKALESLAQAQKVDPDFPETYYWQWRAEQDLKKVSEKPGPKYVALCKSLSPRSYRRYLAEPFLCRRVQEVESSLKKNNTPSA